MVRAAETMQSPDRGRVRDVVGRGDAAGTGGDARSLGGDRRRLRRARVGRELRHDHEYSETFFRDAAEYFEEEETDLLAGARDNWCDINIR